MNDQNWVIDWPKTLLSWLVISIILFFVISFLVKEKTNTPEIKTFYVQTGLDENGPIYSAVPYQCVKQKVLLFWRSSCSWEPVEQEISSTEVFELVGKGYMGVAHGAYTPIPGTGPLVRLINFVMGLAWSASVETGLAMGFLLLVPTVVGGMIVVGKAIKFGSKTVLALSLPLAIFVLGSMTLHVGGRCLLALLFILIGFGFVVWTLRSFSRTRIMTADGSVTETIAASGPPSQLRGGLKKS